MKVENVHDVPSSSNTNTLIFFITGNPGLIAYYDTFFSTLRSLLASYPSATNPTSFTVYGENLDGFEDDGQSLRRQKPYHLQHQIEHVYSRLDAQRCRTADGNIRRYDNIIIMGHSVGTFILLEILQALRKKPNPDLNIQAGILLFPTIVHIAASTNGVVLTKLLKIPKFEWFMHKFAKATVGWLPRSWAQKLVGVVTGMPKDAAAVTAELLQSRMGVWQALFLARDEMEFIAQDKWEEDIWGIEKADLASKDRIPILYLYFAENDEWVASHVRDELIAARACGEGASDSSKPKMMIDKGGVPHAFTMKHSETMAEKVKGWVEEISFP